ncbi:hypothetical protein OG216_44695 [Streptomycetaceae bacterium NBC_01309]
MAALLGAACVAACVSCVNDDIFDSAVHERTREYLRTVAEGAPPTAYYGDCGGRRNDSAHDALAEEGGGFGFALTGSVESGDSAHINVSVTGRDGAPTSYVVDLRREGGTWYVCDVDQGSVDLGGAG